ncbi:helicase [Beggiatoa sp. PS]|nr:helicase [Beggiatoa sp. PS]
MIEHCYNKQNDNSKGKNHYHITARNNLNMYHQHSLEKKPFEFEGDDQFYMEGFRFSRIIDDPCPGIDDTVHLEQFMIPTTPEGILFRLASRNLVFGISATIDIERMLNSFDVPWVNGALYRFQQQKPELYLSDINANQEHIAKLIASKNEQRQTALHNLTPAEELSKNNTGIAQTLSKGIKFLLHEFNKFNFFGGNEYQNQARADRLSRQLETIRWFIEDSERESHIVFTLSFRHLKKLFHDKKEIQNFHKKVQRRFGVEKTAFKSSEVYCVTLKTDSDERKSCYVAFYNTQSSEELELDIDDVFAEGKKVLLITQHASASNGVNLQYRINGTPKDYEGITIIDPQYFFFLEKKEDDKESPYETNIYHLKKLEVGGLLTRSDFEYHLREFSWNKNTNSFYKNSSDRVLGHFVLMSQIMGRIERQWKPMGSTEVRLSDEVQDLLKKFIKNFNSTYEDRKPIMSGIMRLVMEQIEANLEQKDIKNDSEAQNISVLEGKVEGKITHLLNQIERLKKGELTPEQAENVRKVWGSIRIKALQHDYDFSSKRLKRFGIDGKFFSFKTKHLKQATYYYKDGCILPEPDATVPPTDLNRLYEAVLKNPIIKRHFEKRGYRTSFSTINRYENNVFSHLFRQSILQGAIGEEGIKALLNIDPEHIDDFVTYQPYIPIEKGIRDELFEVMDMKVAGAHIYIDAKNWRDSIVRKFYLHDDDDDSSLNEVNHVPKAREKLLKIREVTGVKNVKLIFVLLSLPSDQPKRSNELYCYDENHQPISSYQQASFVYVAGAVKQENPAEWHPAFVKLVKHIKEDISGSEIT